MTIFHLNMDWSQQLWQTICSLLVLWNAITTDKIEKPVSDNPRFSPTVVSKYSASGFFLGLYLWMSLILIHVR